MPLQAKTIGMCADDVYQLDLSATQGDRWWMQLDFTDDGDPLDLTDAAAKLQVRDDNRDVVVTFDSEGTPPTITIMGTQGSIILDQDAVTTAALTADAYTYDLHVTEQPTLEFQAAGWVNIGDITELNSAAAFTLSWWARTEFSAINGATVKIGDQFLFQLMRTSAATDNYAGEALLATVGIHYQIDTLGSRTMTTK